MHHYIRVNLGITKVYLLACSGGYLLIDTGYKSGYQKFLKGLAKAGISVSQIKYLLLTHYHDDHSGFAAELKTEFGVRLIVQEKSVPLLAKGDSREADEGYCITRRMRLLFSLFELFRKDFKYPPVLADNDDILVYEDNRTILRELGISADILFTPGHSADSMSVMHDDGTAFVGDAAMNFMKFTGTHYRPIRCSNLEQTYESIRKLLAAGAETIVPAHGRPFSAQKLQIMLTRFQAG